MASALFDLARIAMNNKRQQTSYQVDTVRRSQEVEERTVWIAGNVNSLPDQLPPGKKL